MARKKGVFEKMLSAGIKSITTPTCGICGSKIPKTVHTWNIDGKKIKACSTCNSELRRKQSRNAVDKL